MTILKDNGLSSTYVQSKVSKIMLASIGEGKDLFEYLKQSLHLPEGVTDIKIRIEGSKPIRVKCKYLPRAGTD